MIGIFMHGLKLLIYKDFLVFGTKTFNNDIPIQIL